MSMKEEHNVSSKVFMYSFPFFTLSLKIIKKSWILFYICFFFATAVNSLV